MDPYIDHHTNLLMNRLNIRDEQQLVEVEAQLLIAGFIDLQTIFNQLDVEDYRSLRVIHRFLFEPLYEWAGEFRTVNIYKSEAVLNGLSVAYSNCAEIERDLQQIFNWTRRVTWSSQNPQLPVLFSKLMTDLWRVHPYREGNTRTVLIFMTFFAEAYHISFRAELLAQHIHYVRNALVLAAIEEAPELHYIQNIVADALHVDGCH